MRVIPIIGSMRAATGLALCTPRSGWIRLCVYKGNPLVMHPNMVFFLHMILPDYDNKRAMTLGHTVLVTEKGCEPLSHRSLDLIING
jgi:Xaa-Pro aminopeptidase